MDDFAISKSCVRCGRDYSWHLRKMRSNLRAACPVCGFLNPISEEQAIAAQRLLERIEMEGRERKVA